MNKTVSSDSLKLNTSPVSQFSGEDDHHQQQQLQLRETPSSSSFMGRIKASTYALLPLGKRRGVLAHHHHQHRGGCHHGATGAHFKVKRHYNTRSNGSVGAGRLEPDMGLPKLSSASLRKSDKVLKLPQLVCDYTTEKKDASRRQARVYRRRRGSALAIPANAGAAATRSDKQQMAEVMLDMRVITRSMADLCGSGATTASSSSSPDHRAKMKRNVMGLNICIERLEQLFTGPQAAASRQAEPDAQLGRRRTPKEAWCYADGTEQRIRGAAKKQAALSSRQPDDCGDLLIEEDI